MYAHRKYASFNWNTSSPSTSPIKYSTAFSVSTPTTDLNLLLWKLNAAIAANPITAIIIAVVLLVVALVALERKFGLVTKSVEMLGQIFEILSNKVDKVLDSIKGVTSAAAELGDALTFGPISGVMNLLGGR